MCQVSGVRYQVSSVRCQVSYVTCQVLRVTCHMSLTPTATAAEPPPANSPTMHSRMGYQDPQINLFHRAILDHFWAKIAYLRLMYFHFFSLRNLFVIDNKDIASF